MYGNLSVNIAICAVGSLGKWKPPTVTVRAIATQGDDNGTEAFFLAWCAMADRLAELAGEDEAASRHLSAGEKYGRACVYYMTAERMQAVTTHPVGTRIARCLEALRSLSGSAG